MPISATLDLVTFDVILAGNSTLTVSVEPDGEGSSKGKLHIVGAKLPTGVSEVVSRKVGSTNFSVTAPGTAEFAAPGRSAPEASNSLRMLLHNLGYSLTPTKYWYEVQVSPDLAQEVVVSVGGILGESVVVIEPSELATLGRTTYATMLRSLKDVCARVERTRGESDISNIRVTLTPAAQADLPTTLMLLVVTYPRPS